MIYTVIYNIHYVIFYNYVISRTSGLTQLATIFVSVLEISLAWYHVTPTDQLLLTKQRLIFCSCHHPLWLSYSPAPRHHCFGSKTSRQPHYGTSLWWKRAEMRKIMYLYRERYACICLFTFIDKHIHKHTHTY